LADSEVGNALISGGNHQGEVRFYCFGGDATPRFCQSVRQIRQFAGKSPVSSQWLSDVYFNV
jgi:hypothetical protein